MTGDQWYYRLDGRPHGPFTPTQFEKLIRGRTVTPATEVSTDGNSWRLLREVLAGAAAEPPPNPPDWMLAPTLVPGQVRLPPEKKPPT